jgi:hypothetical protein
MLENATIGVPYVQVTSLNLRNDLFSLATYTSWPMIDLHFIASSVMMKSVTSVFRLGSLNVVAKTYWALLMPGFFL